ncbi:MAG: Ig-like domain-containing protein [Chloroflexia bacterium]
MPETRPSDRVRDAVLRSAARDRDTGGHSGHGVHPHLHAPFPAGGSWHVEAAGFLMRFDISRRAAVVALAAALLSMLGLAYWLNLLPPLGGYDKFGFLFPRDQELAPIPAAPLPAVSSGVNGVGGSVAAPNLVRLTPDENAQDVPPRQPLRMRFDLPMDRASVQQAISIDPPAAGAFSWDADNEMRFTPAGPGLLRGITYTVTISGSARSLAGTNVAQLLSWSFHTTNPPAVAEALPDGGSVYPTSTFTLTFSEPMDTSRSNDEVSLRTEGAGANLPASYSWSQDAMTLQVVPIEAMPPDTTVTVRVGPSATTRQGDVLGYSSEFAHLVLLPTPRLRFTGGRLSVTQVGAAPSTHVEALEAPGAPLGDVAFDLYSLPGQRLSELGAQAHAWPALLPAGLPGSLEKIRSIKNREAREDPRPQSAGQDLSGLLPGTYLLIASARSASGVTLSDWQLLIVADRRLATADSGALWATLSGGQVWAGAEVSLYSPAGALLEKGITDPAGLWQPSNPAAATLAIARDTEGHLAAFASPSCQASGNCGPNPQSVSPQNSVLSASIITDLPSYRPGQQVNFRALLHPAGREHTWVTPIAEQDVTVSLLNPRGATLSMLTLKPDSVGGVSGLFSLAPSLQPGQYALRVKAGDGWRDYPLPVLPLANDTLSVFVAPPTRALYEERTGVPHEVTRTVSVLGPQGEPAAGSLLTATLHILGDTWSSAPVTATAGADGLATITVPLSTWPSPDGSGHNDPGMYLGVEAAWRGYAGTDHAPLNVQTAPRLLSGMVDMASPSLGVAATAYVEGTGTGKATRLRIVALTVPGTTGAGGSQGELLVIATLPGGERQDWAIDLAGAGGDVTLPLPERFVGGSLYFARAGVEGSRRMSLPESREEGVTLTATLPGTVASGGPLPIKLRLDDIEGQGVPGEATVWFRPASGDIARTRNGWEPSLAIDATGTAAAPLTAPQAPGLWYVMSVAATADGGYASTWSVIDILPAPAVQLPPAQVANTAEPSTISLAIYNPGSTPLSTGLRAEGKGLELTGTSSQNVDVQAGGWQRLDWRFATVPSAMAVGQADLVFSFLPSAGVEDAWTLGVQATETSRTNTTYASGVLVGQRTIGVQVPSGLADNGVSLEIHVSGSLLASLADAAQAPEGAASGSTTAASAFRLSAGPSIAAAYRGAGLTSPLSQGASRMQRALALQQIYAAQHADGGWGAEQDPAAAPSTPAETAGVLIAMWRQGHAWIEAGIDAQPEIDSDVQGRALAYLARESARPLGDRPSTAALDDRARTFYALSLYGAAKAQAVRPLMAYTAAGSGEAHLSTGGVAWLALALWQLGNHADANTLAGTLLAAPVETRDAAQLAPALEALLTTGAGELKAASPESDLSSLQTTGFNPRGKLDDYVRALMEARQGALWATPATSADALWALSDYAPQKAEKLAADPSITLNDRAVQAATQSDNPGALSTVLSGSALHAGTNWLKLQAPTTSDPLYYSLTLRATR